MEEEVRAEAPEQATDHAKVGGGNRPVHHRQGNLQVATSSHILTLKRKEDGYFQKVPNVPKLGDI